MVWLFAGAAFRFLFFKDLAREHRLRTEGVLVEAVVFSETKSRRLSKEYRTRPGEPSRKQTRHEYDYFELKYQFDVPGRGKLEGLYGSEVSLKRPPGSKIEILYLPEAPEGHVLKRKVEINNAYLVRNSLRFIVTVLFFAVPGWLLIKLGRQRPKRASAGLRPQQGGITSKKKNRPKGSILLFKLAGLIVAALFLLMTLLLPPPDVRLSGAVGLRGMPAPLGNLPIGAFFYVGLFALLIGLGVGHAPQGSSSSNNTNSNKALRRRTIVAVFAMMICAWIGMVLHLTQGDPSRARSLIIGAIVGLGSLLLNRDKLKDGSEDSAKDGSKIT